MYKYNIWFCYNKTEAENLFHKIFDELNSFFYEDKCDFEERFYIQDEQAVETNNLKQYFEEATHLDYDDENNEELVIEFICSFMANKFCSKPVVITFSDWEEGKIIIYDLETANDFSKTIYNGNPAVITNRIEILTALKSLDENFKFELFKNNRKKIISFVEMLNEIAISKKQVYFIIKGEDNYELMVDSGNICINKE